MKLFLRSARRSLTDWTDEQLLAAWQEQRKEACFQELFNRYHHLVYKMCGRHLRQAADRKDATLETFAALMDVPASKPIQSLPRWLYGIARNICISRYRAQSAGPVLSGEEYFFEKNAGEIVENEGLLRHINREHPHLSDLLPRALNQLENKQRQCIELFYLEEMTYKEVSEKLGYDLKAVKSYLQNGRRKLSLILQELQSERS
ncbi:MAG: sigma-70 family RNA polymerase sigma factor [Phaeodactylibacter sp.]|uniref:RNA polymerase sigma factor n=1 Tax=Phaeodactylibacter sp. TaxID=1940289 RepID=UPI0032F03D76